MPEKQSLSRLKSRHWYIPLLILTNIGLLIAGWSLPTLKLTKVIFFTSTYSIWAGIVELWKSHHYFLAALIFFFSMIFPTAKLLSLLSVWFVPLTYEDQSQISQSPRNTRPMVHARRLRRRRFGCFNKGQGHR